MSVPILALVVGIANIIVGKLIVGEKRRKISESDGKNIKIIGMVIIAILGFSCLFMLDIFDPHVMKWFWLLFLILTVGFQAFLDWMFLKESKEYIVSLIVLTIGLIYIFIFIF